MMASLLKPCDCKEVQGEVLHEVKEALREQGNATHNHLAEISYTLKILVGLVQRLLSKFEEADGTPKGTPYVVSQTSPVQNTKYPGNALAYDGVIRSFVVSGKGNVTITISDNLEASGSTTIAIIGCAGAAIPVETHVKIPLNATLSIATDDSSGTGMVALTAWIEPIVESNPEYFRMRR